MNCVCSPRERTEPPGATPPARRRRDDPQPAAACSRSVYAATASVQSRAITGSVCSSRPLPVTPSHSTPPRAVAPSHRTTSTPVTPTRRERRHPHALPENVHRRSHTVASLMRRPPHLRIDRPVRAQPRWPTRQGGKTKALPGRPRGAGPIHCVCGRVRTVKARWAHVPPSAAPTLTVLVPTFRENLLGDVHTDVHTGRRNRS